MSLWTRISHINFHDKLDLLVALKSRIGEQKIHVKIIAPDELHQDPLVRSVDSACR